MFNTITEVPISDTYCIERKLDKLIQISGDHQKTLKGLLDITRELVIELKLMNNRIGHLEKKDENSGT